MSKSISDYILSSYFSIFSLIWSIYQIIGSFGVLPDQNMLTNKDLIVIVQSRLPSFTIRQSCRETWGTLGNCDNISFQYKL